jgi:hypothetical protein
MAISKLNSCWNTVFDTLPVQAQVAANGFFDISARQIKEIGGEEPRLMTKMDFADSLPTVLSGNDLSILAIQNGLYRIAKTNPYVKIEERSKQEKIITMPSGYLTLDPFDISSESGALDIAHVSGILSEVFDEKKLDLTIR